VLRRQRRNRAQELARLREVARMLTPIARGRFTDAASAAHSATAPGHRGKRTALATPVGRKAPQQAAGSEQLLWQQKKGRIRAAPAAASRRGVAQAGSAPRAHPSAAAGGAAQAPGPRPPAAARRAQRRRWRATRARARSPRRRAGATQCAAAAGRALPSRPAPAPGPRQGWRPSIARAFGGRGRRALLGGAAASACGLATTPGQSNNHTLEVGQCHSAQGLTRPCIPPTAAAPPPAASGRARRPDEQTAARGAPWWCAPRSGRGWRPAWRSGRPRSGWRPPARLCPDPTQTPASRQPLALVVRPKKRSGLAASMAIGSSAFRLATSSAALMSSALAPGGTSTPNVAVTFTYSMRRATCARRHGRGQASRGAEQL